MSAKFHYEDDLYYLHALVRHLESGIRLELDAEFFWDKTLEDIFFIDATLLRIFSTLKDNNFLISRIEYLRNLRRTDIAFLDFLQRIQEQHHTFSRNLEGYHDKITQTRRSHHRMHEEINHLLESLDPDQETTDIVSTAEFDFLLAANDDEEEQEQ